MFGLARSRLIPHRRRRDLSDFRLSERRDTAGSVLLPERGQDRLFSCPSSSHAPGERVQEVIALALSDTLGQPFGSTEHPFGGRVMPVRSRTGWQQQITPKKSLEGVALPDILAIEAPAGCDDHVPAVVPGIMPDS